MMALLDQMEDNEEFLGKMDKYNIIYTIKNILKGDKQNKLFFLNNGGTQKFTDIILQSDDQHLVEMCISGIAEQAGFKKFMLKMIALDEQQQRDPEGPIEGQLIQIVEKCLFITDDWHKEINHEPHKANDNMHHNETTHRTLTTSEENSQNKECQ